MTVSNVKLFGRRTLNSSVPFSDLIGVQWEEDGELKIFEAQASTTPAEYFNARRKNYKANRRTFKMSPGVYQNTYRLGRFRGRVAFIQEGDIKALKSTGSESLEEEGNFRLNIVSYKFDPTERISPRYRGCQIVRDEDKMDRIVEICEQSGQEFFTYELTEV